MSEEKAIEAARPGRSKRIYVYWGMALTLLIALGLFCWLVVVPVGQVRSELRKVVEERKRAWTQENTVLGSGVFGPMLRGIGGPEEAADRLCLYLWVPDRFAPHKDLAVEALGECRQPGAVPALVRALENQNPEVRECAAEALRQLKSGAAPAVPALIRALDDEQKSVQMRSALVLGAIGPDAGAAVPRLIGLLKEGDGSLVWAAAIALGNIGPAAKEAAPALVKLLNDSDLHVRLSAAKALTQVGEKERGIQALEKLLKAKDDDVRISAAHALFKLGRRREEAVSIIAEGLSPDKGFNARFSAAVFLADLGPDAKAAIPALTRALGDGEQIVRGHAARALGEIGPAAAGAVSELEKLLEDESRWVREMTAEALKKIRAVRNIGE